MTNKTQIAAESLDQTLVALMDKLGYGASKLWTLYVQAQLAQAVANTVMLITVALGIYLGFKFGSKAGDVYNEREKKRYEESEWKDVEDVAEEINKHFGIAVGVTVGFFLTMILGDFIASEIILKLIAPEYTAAQEIIAQINSLT